MSKNGIWSLATFIQIENELYTFKASESSKDFMIPVETLIKDLGYEKKLNGCFASTFTEADSQSSQRSKIKLFEKIFNGFKKGVEYAPVLKYV